LAGARKHVDELQSAMEIKQRELQDIRETVSALEEAEERLGRLEAPELKASLQRQRDAAEREAAEIQSLLDRKVEADAEFRIAKLELETACATITQRAEISGRMQRLAENQAETARSAKNAKDAYDATHAEHARVGATIERLRQQLEIAIGRRIQSGKVAECARASQYFDGLRRQVERGRGVRDRILSLEAELANLRITQIDVDNLQQLEAESVRAQVSLESAATRIEIDPAGNVGVMLGGVPVLQPSSLLLSEVTDILAQGVRIRITPGGDDLESRRRRANDTLGALGVALAALQTESVAMASGTANRRAIVEGELAAQNQLSLAIAPDGFEEILHSLDLAEKRLTALRSELSEAIVVDVESAQSALEQAESAEGTVQGELRAHEGTLMSVRDLREEHRNQLTAVETEIRITESELDNARTALAQARGNQTDEVLSSAVSLAQRNVEHARSRVAETDDRLTTANPEKASDQLRMSKDALDLLSQQISDEKQRVHRLRGALEALGHKGLAEECSDIEAKLVFARLRFKAASDEANALRVLAETILTAEKETNERFLRPVVARVQPYLNRVLPGARLRFDESLGIEGLERGTTVEPYDCISVGAREQISVITRIAFADLLADEGLDAPIILDDALAYSDDRRFRDTLSAIASAAKRHQIILLTCHDERYVRLGARIIHLDSGSLIGSSQAVPVSAMVCDPPKAANGSGKRI
jgi:DNA repair exonuclease SbcCD ATPase subunit